MKVKIKKIASDLTNIDFIPIKSWSRDETKEFIQTTLSQTCPEGAQLARKLSPSNFEQIMLHTNGTPHDVTSWCSQNLAELILSSDLDSTRNNSKFMQIFSYSILASLLIIVTQKMSSTHSINSKAFAENERFFEKVMMSKDETIKRCKANKSFGKDVHLKLNV